MKKHRKFGMYGEQGRYRANFGRSTFNAGKHMIYTEAQDLDEALTLIARDKRHHGKKKRRAGSIDDMDRDLGYIPRKKVTLPKLKFMDLPIEEDK